MAAGSCNGLQSGCRRSVTPCRLLEHRRSELCDLSYRQTQGSALRSLLLLLVVIAAQLRV